MAIRVDPEGREIRALKREVNFRGREVLEIGCGDGRLTLRYASLVRHAYAFDPDDASIRAARRNLPASLQDKVEFHRASAEHLRLPRERFDIALLAWSL